MNKKQIEFLKESHRELKRIEDNPNFTPLKEWKANLLPKLEGTSKNKISRLEIIYVWGIDDEIFINEHEFKMAETVLRDTAFKYLNKKTKEDIEAIKILKAREGNMDFEHDLALIICGDNEKFPYKSSTKLTEFFQNLGYNFIHNGETRKTWVKEKLEQLNVKEIHTLISTGIFRKKYFIDYAKEKDLDINNFLREAKIELAEFIKHSITANEAFDLSGVLDMNVNIELLFDQIANTEDIDLNKLIGEARERFLRSDKQVALEKLWDAFERMKSLYATKQKQKRDSGEKLVKLVSNKFDPELMNEEFLKLGNIGNTYRIRHHEVYIFELTSEHLNYFFFRMLSLIDLCLVFLNKERITNSDTENMLGIL